MARPLEVDDLKFAWAAYKKGGLREIVDEEEMSPEQFRIAFQDMVESIIDGAWIISAPTKRGEMPVGIVLGNWHPIAEVMVVSAISWFPWASARNIVEGTVHFFNEARKDFPFMGYAKPEHKRLYEVVLKHGIMRRIGTSNNFLGGSAAVYETRAL